MNRIGLLLKEDDLISANYAGTLLLSRLGIKSCKLVLQEIAKFDYQHFDTSNLNLKQLLLEILVQIGTII